MVLDIDGVLWHLIGTLLMLLTEREVVEAAPVEEAVEETTEAAQDTAVESED